MHGKKLIFNDLPENTPRFSIIIYKDIASYPPKQLLFWLIFSIICSLSVAVVFAIETNEILRVLGIWALMITALAIVCLLVDWIQKSLRDAFMTKFNNFLVSNGFQASMGVEPDKTSQPFVYGIGSNQHRLLEFSGDISGYKFSVYTHNFTKRHGRSEKNHHYTILHFRIDKSLPHIVLDSRKNDGVVSSIPRYFDDKQRLELEGDFNKCFDFFAPEGYEIEALDILSPDFMVMLMDFHTPFDIEIDEHDVYIISKGINYNSQSMNEMFTAANELMRRFSHKLQSWHMSVMQRQPADLTSYIEESAVRIGRFRITTAIFTIGSLAVYITARTVVETGEFNLWFIGGLLLFFVIIMFIQRRQNRRNQ